MKPITIVAALAALLLNLPVQAQEAATPPAVAPAALLQRSGTVSLKVPRYEEARDAVQAAAVAQDAVLLDAKTLVDPKGRKHGWLRFQMPADRLPRLLPLVYRTGTLYAENLVGTEHASEYEGLARRVESLQAHEARLNGVLQSPRRMRGSDILYLQERLFRASVDEGSLRQEREDMEQAGKVSTLMIQLFEPGTLPVAASGIIDLRHRFSEGVSRAHVEINHTVARGATAGAYALVYAPLWLPIFLLAVLILFLLWRFRTRLAAMGMRLVLGIVQGIRAIIVWFRQAWDARNERIGISAPTSDEEMRRMAN